VARGAEGTAGLKLAHGWSVQFEPIGIVDDAIQDGILERRLADDVVPFSSGKLAGDEDRAVVTAVLDDLHQIASVAGGESVRSSVVEDQQIGVRPIEKIRPGFVEMRIAEEGRMRIAEEGRI
jgi:hypothetical protein